MASSGNSRHITFVKKILADGSPCRKCKDVEERLAASGHLDQINTTLVADERDPASPGMQLAAELNVDRAPFFVVDEQGERQVYTIYFKFAKEVLGGSNESKGTEAKDLLDSNPDLDYI